MKAGGLLEVICVNAIFSGTIFFSRKFMGLNDRYFYEDIGLGSVPDKMICANHLEVQALNRYIRKNAVRGTCSYCDTAYKVLPFVELMEFIMKSVNFFFEDAGNYQPYESKEGGYYWGGQYEPEDIIQDFLQIDATPFEIVTDIQESLDDSKTWTNYYQFYDSIADEYFNRWQFFCKTVKHQTRYLFHHKSNNQKLHLENTNPSETLQDIEQFIKSKKLYKTLPAGVIILRGQQHHASKKAECQEASRLVSPPIEFARNANRFSPSGISMFYGAFDFETVIKEIYKQYVDDLENRITIGKFKLKRDVRLIDLTSIPEIPSAFEHSKLNSSYYDTVFLHQFTRSISEPIDENLSYDIEYVPTQIITEYFKHQLNDSLKKPIEGILYPSAAKSGGTSLVLFWNNSLSLENLELINTTYFSDIERFLEPC
ncbi:hypothetical protein BST97_09670 [Nonlabens spongiae]|uniref:RES domain-containing protein n=1 Tax=Nonlabens spongiae TaxID=331648 RepID=A0A1W6MKY2_9FLAO|nr:HEPN-associated N-terminal domain-containing protein [Nonlabens spongiae]ARN78237.1 hypothetical protein BST97_09670 [Nonlabens spongiae]